MFHDEKLTPFLRELIARSNNDKRLTKQFLYNDRELSTSESEFEDIACDNSINVINGVYHRYPRKILLFPTEHCLSHCRFCFRKFIRGTKKISDNDLSSATICKRIHMSMKLSCLVATQWYCRIIE